MFLAYKITRAKWEAKQDFPAGEISADAVTGDLKTQDNVLSFWRCASGTKEDFEDAVLAIAAGREDVAKVEIVWLNDDELDADGLTLKDTDGRTPVAELIERHVDVCRLGYVRLGKVARRIVSAISEDRYLRLTRARVRNLLVSAVRGGRIELEDLKEKVQTEVQKSLSTSK